MANVIVDTRIMTVVSLSWPKSLTVGPMHAAVIMSQMRVAYDSMMLYLFRPWTKWNVIDALGLQPSGKSREITGE